MASNFKGEYMAEPTQTAPSADQADTIANLFEERDQFPAQKTDEKAPDPKPEQPVQPKVDTEDQATVIPELKTLQEELVKTKKTILENQKYGRQNAQRLKSALKITQELVANGTLSETEAQSLVDSLANNGGSGGADEAELAPHTFHPFAKVLKIANQELDNLRKYSDDELLDDKIKAFDYFLSMAPPAEVKDALEELNNLSDEPIKLTKKMLAMGGRYYDAAYKDIVAAGSIYGYITKKHEEIAKLQGNIDKLTKKLAQYEDFDQPRYRISETGDPMSESDNLAQQDSITTLFAEPYASS